MYSGPHYELIRLVPPQYLPFAIIPWYAEKIVPNFKELILNSSNISFKYFDGDIYLVQCLLHRITYYKKCMVYIIYIYICNPFYYCSLNSITANIFFILIIYLHGFIFYLSLIFFEHQNNDNTEYHNCSSHK